MYIYVFGCLYINTEVGWWGMKKLVLKILCDIVIICLCTDYSNDSLANFQHWVNKQRVQFINYSPHWFLYVNTFYNNKHVKHLSEWGAIRGWTVSRVRIHWAGFGNAVGRTGRIHRHGWAAVSARTGSVQSFSQHRPQL